MGLDVGDKRIGIAFSDESGIIASPRVTLVRDGMEKDIERIIEMARLDGVEEILVGMPISLDGSEGPQARKVIRFIHALADRSGIPVVPWDERFTTVAAEKALLEADVSREHRKHVIDKVAAAYMLQSYLDYRNQKREAERRGS